MKECLKRFKWTWVQFPSAPYCIRGRVVEGTGLIIRFPLERHWFEPSRMQLTKNLVLNLFLEFLFKYRKNKKLLLFININ